MYIDVMWCGKFGGLFHVHRCDVMWQICSTKTKSINLIHFFLYIVQFFLWLYIIFYSVQLFWLQYTICTIHTSYFGTTTVQCTLLLLQYTICTLYCGTLSNFKIVNTDLIILGIDVWTSGLLFFIEPQVFYSLEPQVYYSFEPQVFYSLFNLNSFILFQSQVFFSF